MAYGNMMLKKKTLTVIDNDSLEETVLKVVKLDEAGCILEYQDPAGGILKMYMLPGKASSLENK